MTPIASTMAQDERARTAAPEGKAGTHRPAPSPAARARRFLGSKHLNRRITGWAFVVTLLLSWQIYGSIEVRPELPPLDAIGLEWWARAQDGSLIPAVLDTLRVTAIGFVAAAFFGISLGFLMGRVRPVWALLEPLTELVRQTPVSAMLPLLILYLGIGDELKISIVALVALFPILLNSFAGARSLSRTMQLTAQTFRLSWWQTQREIALPAALPFILVGLRQALGMSLVMAVVTGMLAGNSGVGYFMLEAQQVLNVKSLFAGLLTIALIGYGLNLLFLAVERRLTRWRRVDAQND